MPVMNGPSAAKEIRAKGFDVFIVRITGNVLPDDVAYFRSCVANAISPKPFKLATLRISGPNRHNICGYVANQVSCILAFDTLPLL